MPRLLTSALLLLLLILAPPVATQDAEVNACVTIALAGLTLPQEDEDMLEALIALRDALNGIIARCSGAEVSVISPTQNPYPLQLYVRSDTGWVHVRSEPTTAAPIVVRLTSRSLVDVLGVGEGEAFRGSTRWYQIDFFDYWGKPAWIHSLLLSPTLPPAQRAGTGLRPITPREDVGDPPPESCEIIGEASLGELCVFRFGWSVWGAPDLIAFPDCRLTRQEMTGFGPDWEYQGMCTMEDQVGVAWKRVGFSG